ncbi:MAG: FYDLN acid domain-containing protein [bacterium]|nr:FYDLN acid domain-containing protein [bacterium]
MPKAEWGTKHACTACSAKFYDFKRSPPFCPRCGTIITTERGDPPPAAQEDEVVHDDGDSDVTLETDDDVEGEEDPEIED